MFVLRLREGQMSRFICFRAREKVASCCTLPSPSALFVSSSPFIGPLAVSVSLQSAHCTQRHREMMMGKGRHTRLVPPVLKHAPLAGTVVAGWMLYWIGFQTRRLFSSSCDAFLVEYPASQHRNMNSETSAKARLSARNLLGTAPRNHF